MTSPHTETIEKFAWEGPLSMTQAVLLGVAFAGLLYRDAVARARHAQMANSFVLGIAGIDVGRGAVDVAGADGCDGERTPLPSIAIFGDNSGVWMSSIRRVL